MTAHRWYLAHPTNIAHSMAPACTKEVDHFWRRPLRRLREVEGLASNHGDP